MIKRLVSALALLTLTVGNAFSQSKTISGGNDHGLIICAQGYLYTWGNNFSSIGAGPLLGIDPDRSSVATDKVVYTPQRVKTDNLTFSMVTSGSGAFNLALSCHKTVYAWGDNQNKQCGQESTAGNVVEYPVPVLCGETPGYNEDGTPGGKYLGGVTYIAASTNSGFAIMNDGRVVGWGTGSWNANTGDAAGLPAYIKKKDGTDLTGVTHISGGDDNLLIRCSDGTLWGIGPWNGAQQNAIKYAVQVLKADDRKPLTDIRMSAAGDVCGFAVTGDGYVWSWGQGGWGGSTGVGQTTTHPMAKKVVSGEYKTISGEEFLTDVKEVIGGRGHGAAVTKEGYLVYWGCNDDNGGVVPTDDATAKEYALGGSGVNPVLAKYCDASGEPGEVVTDAVSISRGDNFDFMVNDKDEFYVWGLNDLGQSGTGETTVSKYNCLTKLKTIPCEIQDACPTVFMTDINKCPGEEIELDCGYVIPKGKEDRYYVSWWKDGVLLNSSKKSDIESARLADKYNKATIMIDEQGEYKVKVEYIGTNIPCDACEPDSTTITVTDMDMPIDTVITSMNCVADPLKPAASDVLCYEFTVNDKFYTASQTASFAAFSTADSKDTLDIESAKGAGGAVKFCVSGDKIAASEVHDNKNEESKDTTYTVWVEDITQFNTTLLEKSVSSVTTASGNYYGNFTQIISLPTAANLKSFSLLATGTQDQAGTMTVTPIVLKAGNESSGGYTMGETFWTGEEQTFTLNKADGIKECVVKCGVVLPANSVRGSSYVLAMKFTINNGGYVVEKLDVTQSDNSVMYDTPFVDSEGFGIKAIGCTANGLTTANPGKDNPFWNITFGKMTDYDCGRIQLTAKYGCPPCNQPDGIIEIASSKDVNAGVGVDTVALCKEDDPVTLSVENVVKASEPSASFDIQWFTDRSMVDTKAIQSDPASTKSSITVKWDDVPEGTSQTYYMKIRDAEKPDASSCWVIDSIVVKANKVPVAPEITIDPYCEGKLTADEFLTIASKFLTLDGYTVYSLLNDSGTELKGDGIAAVASVSADLQALTAGEHKYTMTVQDAATGCMSEPAEIPITVYAVPEAPTTSDLSMLKTAGVTESVAAGATAAEGCTITWATKPDFSDGVASAPSQDKSEAGTFTYYVKQTSADGCESDSAHFTVTVNDAPMPNTRDTVICLGDAVDLSTRVSSLSSEYQLNWYTTETAEKGTGSTEAPTFAETKPGVYTYYVSQTNTTTTAESEKNKFTVTVIGVDPATVVTPEVTYCKDADATSVESMISLYQDVNSYYYADATGTTWTLDGLAASATDLVPVTAVATTTSYEYTATQTYTITSSAEVCKGEPVSVKVNVTVLDAPTGELMVNYLKSDAADNGNKFKNLVAQNPNVATATTGCTLKWYDSDGLTALTSAPVPPYDANQSEDVEYTYYVSQVNADGCESEKSKVIVTISSSPMPTPNHVAYCEGDEEAAAMTANIQTTGSGKDTDADYELVWYSSNPNEVSTTAEKEALQVASAPVADVKITDGSNKQIFTYYVAQKNKNTQAVSRAIPVCDTVYAAPVLSTKNPTPVCEPATIDLSSKEIWSDAVSQNWAFAWLDESQTTPVDDPEHISQSGTFYAQAWFMVNGKKCVSNLSEIKADIHYVRNLAIEGSTTTCPNTTVDLAATYDAINPDAQAEFTWTCAGSGENTTLKSPKLTTTELAGPAGKTYTYNLSVTAGACVGISGGAHVITIGDGPIEGSVVFSEDGNTDSRTETASADGLTFYSCGGSLTIDASGVKNTGDDFVWTANGATVNTGATYTIASPTNATYHLTYTNNCSTGFDIKVVSVPLAATASNTATDICENDNFSANVLVSCAENTYKIAWYHDGTEMAGQSGSDLKFSPATTDNNGTYSYKVTNRGCTFEGDIANGNALTVKPYIKFTNQTEYIARRDSQLSIPLTFTEPASGEPSTIEWKEGGVNFATGNPLSLTVTADHNFNIVAQDDNYCEATGKVSVKMDARLQLSAELDNQMCSGDYRELVIDTTGTGAFIDNSKMQLYIIENVGGVETPIYGGWSQSTDGLLHYNVTPVADATYTIHFDYRLGEGVDAQSKTITKTLMVLPPIEIEVPTGLSMCGDGESELEVALTSVTPAGTMVVWDDDESIISSREGTNTIKISPSFDESKTTNSTYKSYAVRATYSICQEKTAYVTVRVDRPLKGSVVGPEIICEGNSATIDASSYDADSYSWTSAEDTTFAGSASSMITVSPTVTTAYNVDMVRGECSANDTWTVAVSYRPTIASVDSISYKSRDIQVNGGTSPYTYWIDKVDGTGSVNSTFDDLAYGSHIAYVTDEAGCSTSAPFVMYAPEIKLPPVVSPDNNGIKDRFEDPVIKSAYPNAKISIYDRWGKKLAEYSGAEDGWDGTYNGHAMPSTDYWYEVEIKELNKTYTGHFTLMRQ